jgi:UDP-galactopyranose mutase
VNHGSKTGVSRRSSHAPHGASARRSSSSSGFDLLCFSHLRWDFVYQRPQHLLSRCARYRRVFFVEEPVFHDEAVPAIELHERHGLTVVVPRLRHAEAAVLEHELASLISRFMRDQQIHSYISWYYTPMALGFTRDLSPLAIVYDCMDELTLFKFAPAVLRDREAELLRRADVVFTGGQSLFEAKREQHGNVHLFPSSIDREHFAKARQSNLVDPPDQRAIPHPRIGYCGVLDERLDLSLLRDIAASRPDWHLVMVGPVVKIDPADLPGAPNIHYLGAKSYAELPAYLAGWEVALLPFAQNDSTRFISPTKTPEYLAAGKPVVSTPVADVVRGYGVPGLVEIASDAQQFVAAIERAMAQRTEHWLARVDEHLAGNSWDLTWERMSGLIEKAVEDKQRLSVTEGLSV